MLKCILLLLSQYYYGITLAHVEEIRRKVSQHQVRVFIRGISDSDEMDSLSDTDYSVDETLFITDDPEMTGRLLNENKYVVILYHEQNRGQRFPAVPYAIEELFQLDYKSYEEVYQRLAGLPWEILQTDRLLLRESTIEDVDEFYRIYRNPSITLYMEDLYKDRDEELAYMKAYIDQIYTFYGYGLWSVILKENGQVIGRAGLSVREGYDLPELGFLIDVSYQRQGYGYEVCSAILKYAGEELEFDKVQALADGRNLVSIHLLEKLGFRFGRNVSMSDRDYKLFIKNI